jgi:hypothetical protein
MGMASVFEIARDHFRTLHRRGSSAISRKEVISQFLVPFCAGIATYFMDWHLADATGAIAGISIVAALMCAMAVFIFQIRLQIHQDQRLIDDDFTLIDEVFSNVMWAILVGLGLALYLVVFDALGLLITATAGSWLTAFAVFVAAYFVVVVCMCLKRLRRAYERIGAQKA